MKVHPDLSALLPSLAALTPSGYTCIWEPPPHLGTRTWGLYQARAQAKPHADPTGPCFVPLSCHTLSQSLLSACLLCQNCLPFCEAHVEQRPYAGYFFGPHIQTGGLAMLADARPCVPRSHAFPLSTPSLPWQGKPGPILAVLSSNSCPTLEQLSLPGALIPPQGWLGSYCSPSRGEKQPAARGRAGLTVGSHSAWLAVPVSPARTCVHGPPCPPRRHQQRQAESVPRLSPI